MVIAHLLYTNFPRAFQRSIQARMLPSLERWLSKPCKRSLKTRRKPKGRTVFTENEELIL